MSAHTVNVVYISEWWAFITGSQYRVRPFQVVPRRSKHELRIYFLTFI